MRLNNIQESFKDLMLQPPQALETPGEAFAALFEEGDIPLHERLKVYRSNVIGGITDALIATFPLLKDLVGEEFLRDMARAFVIQNPPQAGCLNMYGAGFDTFIETFPLAKDLQYLPDIARLELAINEAYFAPDDESLSAQSLSAILPESLPALHLKLRASARLIESKFPLDKIRAFCLDPENQTVPNIQAGGVNLLILRPKLDIEFTLLDDDELMALSLLQKKNTFGAAIEQTLQAFPSFDLPAFLQKHIALETFQTLWPNRLI